MAVRFTPGNVLKVPVPGGRSAYALMTNESTYIAFYAEDALESDDAGKPTGLSGAPLFTVSVEPHTYSQGGWGSSILRIPKADIPPLPEYFQQDVGDPSDCLIIASDGSERKATPEECVGLERLSAWGPEAIETRLEDHYAGRPNRSLESLKVEL
jgi:hypothetical protein